MAVAAIDAKFAGVVLMTKLGGLRLDYITTG
jgi:hypothetical protein